MLTITMANLLNTTMYSYDVSQKAWVHYQPHNGTDVNTLVYTYIMLMEIITVLLNQ